MGRGARRDRRGGAVAATRLVQIRIVAVGRAPSGPERSLFERYAARLRPALELRECNDGFGRVDEIRRREAVSLQAAMPSGALLVALDQAGEALASTDLARRLAGWSETGRPLAFAIGGAEGLDRTMLDRADASLSLGPQTWPHLLARVMLAEQLFRAQSILAGHPYHRATRP